MTGPRQSLWPSVYPWHSFEVPSEDWCAALTALTAEDYETKVPQPNSPLTSFLHWDLCSEALLAQRHDRPSSVPLAKCVRANTPVDSSPVCPLVF
eukprot:CAMPEP_0174380276 /NCGR_PEP_ID=MMETSP0811_2-20130205/123268_1 /TAXON_ID=73025 ORGANISM="Eutreptiella gymnastica-like, Strain CCMP1594" /NCGR_SAMPLE_ID=MMETSP0811_2 /ASSEMBLY_ACC=CAM_ASM_000667 /LENGTH=94 /DNA_ID=CAMNT_0015533095 /DNA_START=903 /DNA_END=1187 /DNA_ORIENTATION=+